MGPTIDQNGERGVIIMLITKTLTPNYRRLFHSYTQTTLINNEEEEKNKFFSLLLYEHLVHFFSFACLSLIYCA